MEASQSSKGSLRHSILSTSSDSSVRASRRVEPLLVLFEGAESGSDPRLRIVAPGTRSDAEGFEVLLPGGRVEATGRRDEVELEIGERTFDLDRAAVGRRNPPPSSLQLLFGDAAQGAVETLFGGVPGAGQMLGQKGPRQAFGDPNRIVVEGGPELEEPVRRATVRCHALDLGGELGAREGPAPDGLERGGGQQAPLHPCHQRALGKHLRQSGLGSRILLGPDAMFPVDRFDGPLAGQTLAHFQPRCRARLEG